METFSALLALCAGNSPVTGEFPSQRPVTWSFDVFFDLRLNKWLSKQLRRRWFETPSRSLWRHSNAAWIYVIYNKLRDPACDDDLHISHTCSGPYRDITRSWTVYVSALNMLRKDTSAVINKNRQLYRVSLPVTYGRPTHALLVFESTSCDIAAWKYLYGLNILNSV